MSIPRWYLEQTLDQEDLDEITKIHKELFQLRGCCRDHVEEIAALEASNAKLKKEVKQFMLTRDLDSLLALEVLLKDLD